MANHRAKGGEYLRVIGRRGGMTSGEVRWHKKMAKDLELAEVPVSKEPGGLHANDWRCPECRGFNSIKNRRCSKCGRLAPPNGRITRRALRERAKEHKTMAILRIATSPWRRS